MNSSGVSFSQEESILRDKFLKLKKDAGSHSPSIFTFKQKLPELNVKIDSCFLSNPYATDLFLDYFKREVIDTGKIRELLEFYPSQNNVIAELLGDFLQVPRTRIFIGNGAIEIIQAVLHNFTKSKLLINIPTFSSYYEFVNPGVQVVYNRLKKSDNFQLDVESYIQLVKKERPDTVVLINPNNPDGSYIQHNVLENILSEISFVDTVILDESFIHFAYEDESFQPISNSDLVEKYPNVILIKSMSKDFGIAGIRAGYAIMDDARVSRLLQNGYLWNSNGLSEYFFRLYTRADFAYNYNQVRVRYILDTIDFIKELGIVNGIKVYPSRANFVLLEILKDGVTSSDFVTGLLIKYGVYVRTCSDKIGLENQGEYIRLASRTRQENAYVSKSIEELLK
jgi:histidinol-phosphate/aromatic aminotransferase/cobyric acid decarboxylase-like protein